MTFRRFLAWIVEKLLEWQLFVLVLVGVRSFLPTAPQDYVDFHSFITGVRETWSASLEDASYMASAFMGNSYAVYAMRTYEAAAYVVGVHFYLLSFYLLASIFACVTGPRGYLRHAILAFLASAVLLGVRLRELYDIQNTYLAGALIIGGLIAVILSALVGNALDAHMTGRPGAKKKAAQARPRRDSSRGRVRFDLGQ